MIDLIESLSISELLLFSALAIADSSNFLIYDKQKGSSVIKKLLESAIANAENNSNSDIDKLSIKSIIVNQGMRLKRMKPRARGRADRIIKPTCHIEIILTEEAK
jgi:large subunit ribosomal protein L22